ncbi:hypothetical protein AVEN_184725-1 [Araneus ventricosus]|uniref:Uncharacterized protein n=1 Tax=Araneus ventricosus TaxID=182803 RepID=A0A4Y2TN32_ARAVE|nr:hypothetical protein AVEN_184725-1 [Araneus ventricosus]
MSNKSPEETPRSRNFYIKEMFQLLRQTCKKPASTADRRGHPISNPQSSGFETPIKICLVKTSIPTRLETRAVFKLCRSSQVMQISGPLFQNKIF